MSRDLIQSARSARPQEFPISFLHLLYLLPPSLSISCGRDAEDSPEPAVSFEICFTVQPHCQCCPHWLHWTQRLLHRDKWQVCELCKGDVNQYIQCIFATSSTSSLLVLMMTRLSLAGWLSFLQALSFLCTSMPSFLSIVFDPCLLNILEAFEPRSF